jgi:hypothetical protein
VSGQTPVVDAVNAGTSTNFNQEMLENIPTSRSQYFDTISFVPGVKSGNIGGSSPSIFGSATRQNAIKYEGMDFSDASYGGPFDWINYEMMQEIEVKAVGASAEHGGFQGGMINIILKSGTDTWKGGAGFWGQWQWLRGNNVPGAPFPGYTHHNHDVNFEIGGPLKEGLWVQYINENIHSRSLGFGQDPKVILSSPTVRWVPYVKVNARLSANDQIQAHYNDSFDRWGGSGSITTPLHTGNTEMGNDPLASATWTRSLSSATMFEAKFSGLYVRKWRPPTSRDFETPRHTDEFTGNRSVNSGYVDRWHRNRNNYDAALSHVTRDHELKFGVQTTQALVITYDGWAQNVSYIDFNGAPYYARFQEPTANAGKLFFASGFAQDNWRISDRLTLNLGVRYDFTKGEVPEAKQYDYTMRNLTGRTFPGVDDIVSWNDISPRIGGVYVLDQAGKTAVKASYGRYFSKLTTNMFGTLSPGATAQNYYYYNPATRAYDTFWYSEVPLTNYAVDPDLTNYYTDQYFVGIEREVFSNFGIAASYIYKKDGNPIAVKDVGGRYVEQIFNDVFEGVTTPMTVYNRVSPSRESRFTVMNRPELDHDYKSFIIEANKRWSRGWQTVSSYQWQRSLGYPIGGSTSASGFGADPNDLINTYARDQNDTTHSVRVSTTYAAPLGIQIGFRYFLDTGKPWGRQVTVRGLGQGNKNIYANPIGSYEFPSFHDVRLRLDKDLRFAAKRLRLSLDIVNLLNVDTPQSVRTNSTQANFGQLLSPVGARQGRIGIRFDF